MTIITPHGDRNESFVKASMLTTIMFDLTRTLAELPEALDMADCGNTAPLDAIYEQIKTLRETISGDDRYQSIRVKPVIDSKVLRVLDGFMKGIDDGSLDPDKAVMQWGETYAKFLTACEEMKASQNQESLAEERRNVRSKSQNQIPTKTGRSGIVIYNKASIVFTTEQPIPEAKRKRMPERFEIVKYASGYVINNQIVLGVNKDDEEKDEKIKQTLAAFRANGQTMVNLLDNSRRTVPFFLAKHNPLQFVWLFPQSAWQTHTFKVVSVQFNTTEAAEDFSPHASREYVRKQRQEFEEWLGTNRQYKAAVAAVQKAKEGGDSLIIPNRKLKKTVEDLLTIFRQERQGASVG
jgi:hypothetical protein